MSFIQLQVNSSVQNKKILEIFFLATLQLIFQKQICKADYLIRLLFCLFYALIVITSSIHQR